MGKLYCNPDSHRDGQLSESSEAITKSLRQFKNHCVSRHLNKDCSLSKSNFLEKNPQNRTRIVPESYPYGEFPLPQNRKK
jgi:hypothetical protein